MDPWIYRRLSDEKRVDVPAGTGRDPATTMLPAITTAGINDHLVQRTFNGLRDDDLALEQPSQWPGWTP